jgi:hypothetical protein
MGAWQTLLLSCHFFSLFFSHGRSFYKKKGICKRECKRKLKHGDNVF